MSGEINVISRTQQIIVEPISSAISIINAGPQGPGGASSRLHIMLVHPQMAPSVAATNIAASTFVAVSDPSFRTMVDLAGFTKVRMQGRLSNVPATANKIRIQYHTSSDLTIGSADAGWATLCTTIGSHINATLFYTPEMTVPVGAQIAACQIRCGIFDGDGISDPTISCCMLNFYT